MMKRAIRVLAVIPNKVDSTSFYRGAGPLNHMMRNFDLDLAMIGPDNTPSWADIGKFDLVFMQRPTKEKDYLILLEAKKMGIPTVVDYDDDVFSVPMDNPAFKYYTMSHVRQMMGEILKSAASVFVSTQDLYNKFSKINPACFVIRNAIDDIMFKKFPRAKRNKTVSWRGTDTHERDLREFKDAIIQAAKENKDFNFAFIGYNPWYIAEEIGPQWESRSTSSVLKFFSVLHDVGAAINIVPLSDNTFNRSKSNIAFLESTIIGSSVLCPTWEEWQCDGASHYSSPNGFYLALTKMMKNLDECAKDNDVAREFIRKHFMLSKANAMRYKVFSELTGITPRTTSSASISEDSDTVLRPGRPFSRSPRPDNESSAFLE